MHADAQIVTYPNVMMGKPVVAGTRLTVEFILEELAAGTSPETLVADHPSLTRDGIAAALRYAAGILRTDIVYPVQVQ